MIKHRFVSIRRNGKPHGITHILQSLPKSNTNLIICDLDFTAGDIGYDITVCGVDSFVCNSGTCLAPTSRCDGHFDFTSGEDELKCKELVDAGGYICRGCKIIAPDKRCNMINDCPEGNDELNCFIAIDGCPQQFRCSSGQCVHLETLRDGIFKCVDHSDERSCLESCIVGFLCTDSNCVLQSVEVTPL